MKSAEPRTELNVEGRRFSVAHLDRALWPELGFSKADLLAYYRAVAPALLPHIRGRLMTLVRYPEGIEGPGWYQLNCRGEPDWVRTVAVQTRAGPVFRYAVLDDLPSLLWAASIGTLELHPYLATVDAPEHPSWLVVDLDPGPPAHVLDCVEIALRAREWLDARGLASFAKTSGRRGLHLYVPLNGTEGYERSRPFAREFAEALRTVAKDRVVTSMRKADRAGKVFLDWGQNHAARSTAAPYSLRVGPEPCVSTPVTWEELAAAQRRGTPDALRFTPAQVLARLDAFGDLFAEALTLRQALPAP